MSMDELQSAVGTWHRNAFPDEHPLELALCSAEELGELCEALDETKALQLINTRLTRAFLKESHGTNDRRGDVDWSAVVYDELGDVLVVLAAIADARGWSLTEALRARLAFITKRFAADVWTDIPGLAHPVVSRRHRRLRVRAQLHRAPVAVGREPDRQRSGRTMVGTLVRHRRPPRQLIRRGRRRMDHVRAPVPVVSPNATMVAARRAGRALP